MFLSILIPAVFERGFQNPIYDNLHTQIGGRDDVEILTLFDNRKRSTGRKRQALLDMAQGTYVTHLDDDDDVATDYLETILTALEANQRATQLAPDVLTFNSEATLGTGNPFVVRTGLDHENEQCRQVEGRWIDIKRKPWHWCLWHSRLAHQASFPDGYIDDDWFWIRQMLPHVQRELHIDRTLHYYWHRSDKSLANQGKPTT